MRYSDVLTNEHFNNLAAIVRSAMRYEYWKIQHPDVKLETMLNRFDSATTPLLQRTIDKHEILASFTELIKTITMADKRLFYTTEDMGWLIGVIDSDDTLVILNMLKAWYSAPDTMFTPEEIAEKTGTSESNWRNKAAFGDIPGATKKGKQWLLPASVLRSRGIAV